jgi:uncharacterized protein YndB with AHSA1/START domain
MPSQTQSLRFTRTVQALPAEVFRAFTHATALRDWLAAAAASQPQPGGGLYLRWNSGYAAHGTFTALEPGRKVAFTWQGTGEPSPSRVQVSLAEKNGGSRVTLTHSGLGRGKAWAASLDAIQSGWETGLENLQSVLERGIDLRFMRTPRMGVVISDFNAEAAARLGVPVSAGALLEGTAEGSGARAAGLQKDDVIVRLGGKPVTGFASLGPALTGHQAGERVPVVFYRGPEKRTVKMVLGQRPEPPALPETGAALADRAAEMYATFLRDMESRLAHVSEAEADHRPAPGEWSLKELVAHFIACERDLQSWIADMVNDNTAGDSLEFRPNVTPRLEAIVSRFQTLPALQAELRQAAGETQALLRALPPAFVTRKHLFRRVTDWVLSVVPSHLPDEHGGQFEATLAAARRS